MFKSVVIKVLAITKCAEKVKVITWSGQVTDCCGKSSISIFVHFAFLRHYCWKTH